MNVKKLAGFTDYFVIATVLSNIQMKVAIDSVIIDLKQRGIYPAYRNNFSVDISQDWQTLDYISVVVHIMSEKARKFYSLERLWYKARKIKI